MADGVKIEIVSPERLVLSEQARSVTVPGADGYFTVLGDHAPLMTTLKPGFITVTDTANVAHVFYVRGGFADVAPGGLTILAEEARPVADFNRTEIEALIAAGHDGTRGGQDRRGPGSPPERDRPVEEPAARCLGRPRRGALSSSVKLQEFQGALGRPLFLPVDLPALLRHQTCFTAP